MKIRHDGRVQQPRDSGNLSRVFFILPGKNLAMLAIKFVLAKLILAHKLDTFEYLPQSRVELQANPGLLKLKNGLRCRASPV